MNTKNLFRYFILSLILTTISCQHQKTPQSNNWADSLISATLKTGDDDRVLALIDSLDREGDLSYILANFRRGYAYERKGQRYFAELYWKKVMEVTDPRPEDFEYYCHTATFLANRLIAKNDYEGAVRVATTALKKMENADGVKPLFKAMLLQVLAGCQIELKTINDADNSCQRSFEYFLQGIAADSTEYSLRNAIIGLDNITKNYLKIQDYDKATMWLNRGDSLLTVYKNRPDARPEKVDKLQAMIYIQQTKIGLKTGHEEESANAFKAYESTDYAKTTEGRFKANSYLMKEKRYAEVADNYYDLDKYIGKKNGKMNLETIKVHYTTKFKANLNAGRKDTALAVASKVFNALDSAIIEYKDNETAELYAIYNTQQKEAEIVKQQAELLRQRFIGIGVAMLLITGFFVLYTLLRRRAAQRLAEVMAAQERIESELRIARDIQLSMVQHEFPDKDGLDMYASMTPAREVGGDLYNYLLDDDKLYFCVGDVSGKGVPASLFMAQCVRLFRTLAAQGMMPAEICTKMNAAFSENNEQGMFVTMFIGLLDLPTGHLNYCNAGHNPPVIGGNALHGELMNLIPNAPLGLWPKLEFKGEEINSIKGKPLFIYTDGLTEAEDDHLQQFGEESMLKLLRNTHFDNSRQVIESMTIAVEEHRHGAEANDDLTMLCLRVD